MKFQSSNFATSREILATSDKFKIILLCLFAYLLICLFPKKAIANELSLGIYPPVLQIHATPSARIMHPVTIINNSNDLVNIQIIFKPFFSASQGNGDVTYLGENDFLIKSDGVVNGTAEILNETGGKIDEILLTPHEEKTLTLSLDLSKNHELKDTYFSILFLSKNNVSGDMTQSAISGGIAMHVLLSLQDKNEIKPLGFIKTFSTPFFTTEGPVHFQVEVTNSGDHFINPKGTMLIRNMFGQTIGKVTLLPAAILAHSTRFLPDNKAFSDTDAIWPEKFLLGWYTAKVTIALSDKGPLYSQSTYFFSLPWPWLIGSIICIVFTIIVAIRVRERLE